MRAGAWIGQCSFEVVIKARTIEEASCGLRTAFSSGPTLRKIRLLLDPKNKEVGPWFDSARMSTPEIRGAMVQAFFARILRMAGYNVTVGKSLDIFARNGLRSLFVEVKSSLNGTKFGSRAELAQLEGYLGVSERRRAEIWLGIMGLNRPMRLRDAFKAEMRIRNIGLIDIRWISPEDTLLPHLGSID